MLRACPPPPANPSSVVEAHLLEEWAGVPNLEALAPEGGEQLDPDLDPRAEHHLPLLLRRGAGAGGVLIWVSFRCRLGGVDGEGGSRPETQTDRPRDRGGGLGLGACAWSYYDSESPANTNISTVDVKSECGLISGKAAL